MKRFGSQKGLHLLGELLIEGLDAVGSVHLLNIQQGAFLKRELVQKLLGEEHPVPIADFAYLNLHAQIITTL